MTLGYEGRLFILAFDHRGSFRRMFGIKGREPTADELETLKDGKMLVWEGFKRAWEEGAPKDAAGILVDEEMGTAVAREAKELGVQFAMPVEASGEEVFQFEYGEEFGAHIEEFDPTFSKVLVRYNPESDSDESKQTQIERLKRLSDWLHDNDRKFLFELLVPASDEQLESVDGDQKRYDAEVRPALVVGSIKDLQDGGVEPDIWKIEGLEEREQCEQVAQVITRDGRDDVVAVVLGRGADAPPVDHWLQQGAPVPSYAGFAIGRTIWRDAVQGFVDGEIDRDKAAATIAENYQRFIDVYDEAS